ncbi:S8 family serine peptidase [Rubrivirga sp. S365]|uniref:S8 family serine peptidase n=1 Tax=Rubrivirga litoralis TaxID=3075598 RepID=A0ABU3BR00_9BACT|nr:MULTISPECIES: S8 family serine peptidase [unclassified Rubrivirga]MDT0631703.1 S8 family serine peptidase [Rubrivirga sp. F394]MDT7855553.1 S8 family serine peptidase [Rubrivirga sp. S365]
MTLRPLLAAAALVAAPAFAQDAAPPPPSDWHLLGSDAGVAGIDLDRAYAELGDRDPEAVVVAIIDSGVDVTHPDIEPALWTNEDEVAGNGVDDDGNGYVDDVHGWSFLGGADGRNVEHDSYELARLVKLCRDGTPDPTYTDCEALEADLEAERAPLAAQAAQIGQILGQVRGADATLRERFGDDYDPEDPTALDVGDDPDAQRAQQILGFLAGQGASLSDVEAAEEQISSMLTYGLNPDYDPREIVGDDYADVTERFYGNTDVAGPDPNHGTGVAGLVGAVRGNNLGIDGIAPARIMVLRAVPGGDERDKDVANAIRYAADNGARVINMSFGKSYSPQKEAVDEAVAYAVDQGVLLVHAAGNSGEDIDVEDNFPTRTFLNGTASDGWLEVGASTADSAGLAAGFSNYGQAGVDLFAPGADVTSLAPGGGVQTANGTSFASPVVAGVAALVMAYFPDFTAEEVRQILLDSATRYADDEVARPGSGEPVAFGTLSATGGVVNAAEAIRLARERSM